MRLSNRLRSFGLMAALATQLLASAIAQVACVNFEVKQTNPVHLSPDGTRLFAVNTPNTPDAPCPSSTVCG